MSGLQLIFAADYRAPRAVSLARLRLVFATGYRASTFAVSSSAGVVLTRFGVSAFGDLASGCHVRSSRGAFLVLAIGWLDGRE